MQQIFNNRFWYKHAPQLALALGVLILLLSLASVAFDIWSAQKRKKMDYQAQAITLPKANKARPYQVNDIVRANLFGNPTVKKVATNAPKTTLKLTLQGILSASDQAMARAIIQSGNKKTDLYSVGENIKGTGAKVKEIRDHEIILDRSGAIESLPLVKKGGSGNRQILNYQTGKPNSSEQAYVPPPASRPIANVGSTPPANRSRPTPGLTDLASNQQTEKEIIGARKRKFSGLDRALEKVTDL